MRSDEVEVLTRAGPSADPGQLIDRYRRLLVETDRVRARLDALTRLEARLLLALRESGVAYRRLAREMAAALQLGKSGVELRRLAQRLRQRRRRRAARLQHTDVALAEAESAA